MEEYRISGAVIQGRIDGGVWSDLYGADYTLEEIKDIRKSLAIPEGFKFEQHDFDEVGNVVEVYTNAAGEFITRTSK